VRLRVRDTIAIVTVIALSAVACGEDDLPPAAIDTGEVAGAGECQWPMWGHNLSRTFAYPCETALSVDTVPDLGLNWFFNTDDVVTATPAVVDGTAYVGDWSGRFYALDTSTGKTRWTFDADTEPNVYAGQIVASAAVAEIDDNQAVVFASARTLYAVDAREGTEIWRHAFGTGGPDDYTEIESSPAIFDDVVLIGTDTHNRPTAAGLHAVDLSTGEHRWSFDPEQGEHRGCGDVWSSPSVDTERRLVFFGTANCPSSPEGWGEYTEAIIAVDVDTGRPRWSFQPHGPNNDDLDFAGAPNLFTVDGRDLVGLGNKDGTYYAVDRETGEPAWDAEATGPGIDAPGRNFSTGGFIGPTAYWEGVLAGGTAVGPAPYLHAFSAANGTFLWQTALVQETYAASAIANGVLFVGGNDFTFRAIDLYNGRILWSHEMQGVVAGGAAIVGDDLYAVAGIREPGLEKRSETSGVYKFSLRADGDGTTTTGPATTTTAAPVRGLSLEPNDQRCIATPCEMFPPGPGIVLRSPPEGLSPSAELLVTTDPFTVTLRGRDLGEPQQWLVPGTAAAEAGATVFGLFISESDDNPVGGLLCILDNTLSCSGDALPRPAPSYNRITLLALRDGATAPTLADGAARLLVTVSFEPPLRPVGGG
jgi:outer membrane protein assembly factor BamB